MTIQTFIEKAIEGGWCGSTPRFTEFTRVDCESATIDDNFYVHFRERESDMFSFHLGRTLLRPEVWKAVGKVEGWCCIIGFEYQEERLAAYDHIHFDHRAGQMPQWKYNMHRMIDALAEGKTIEQYLETL